MAVAGREADHPKVIDSVTRPNWPLPFRPSLERTFTAGDTLRVFFQIRRTSARVPAQGVAAIVDASGREVMRRTFDITGDRLTEHDLTLPLAGLAPGGYAVEVSAIGAAHQATQRVGIVVREAG
jgi:hypothetical protein